MRTKFAELNKEEETWYRGFCDRLASANRANSRAARELLEAARVELHQYCALAEEGDLLERQVGGDKGQRQ